MHEFQLGISLLKYECIQKYQISNPNARLLYLNKFVYWMKVYSHFRESAKKN